MEITQYVLMVENIMNGTSRTLGFIQSGDVSEERALGLFFKMFSA